jgi:hypothetical protein
MLIKIADAYTCNKKTYNNAISALRRAFNFGYLDYSDRADPAASLKCARIGKNDRPPIDPFSIQDAEVLIAAIHRDWGLAQGNYDELRFFTGLRPSEEIALVVTDYDAAHGVLSVTKARVLGIGSARSGALLSVSQAVRGEAHVGELEPADRAQSPVGGERAWPPAHHDAIRVRGLDGRSGGNGHCCDSRRDEPHGRDPAQDGSRSTRDRDADANARRPARRASGRPVAHTANRSRARMG